MGRQNGRLRHIGTGHTRPEDTPDVSLTSLPLVAATLMISLVAFSAMWLISFRLRDASVVDAYWGPGFAVVGAAGLHMAGQGSVAALLVLGCVSLWAVRLAVHIVRRHTGEDARYRAMRQKAGPSFAWTSLVTVFWLQALIQWCVATPLHALVVQGQAPLRLSPLFVAGAALFLVGFAIEWAADTAVSRFRSNPANAGRLLTTGLHGLCRHPNYLGEIVLWWGLGTMAFAATNAWWAFAGPALLTALIMKLSGVPMLDALFRDRPGYAEWVTRTPALWPRLWR